MEITYLGRGAFRLKGKEVTIVTDPDVPAAANADIVTASRRGASSEGQDQGQVNGPGEYEIKDVLIAGMATESEPGTGPVNTAYLFRLDDLVLCHLGDLNKPLTDRQIETLGNIDILFVPVGGSGLNPTEAAEAVTQLEPSMVVPMQMDGDGELSKFCRELGAKEFEVQPKLVVTRGTLPGEVRVVVLEERGN